MGSNIIHESNLLGGHFI